MAHIERFENIKNEIEITLSKKEISLVMEAINMLREDYSDGHPEEKGLKKIAEKMREGLS